MFIHKGAHFCELILLLNQVFGRYVTDTNVWHTDELTDEQTDIQHSHVSI